MGVGSSKTRKFYEIRDLSKGKELNRKRDRSVERIKMSRGRHLVYTSPLEVSGYYLKYKSFFCHYVQRINLNLK